MTQPSCLVFSGIAPHPPIMVPEVGRESIANVVDSIEAMAELSRRVIDSGAETVILISPHAPLEIDSFVAYEGPEVTADFSNFSAPEIHFTAPVDEHLLSAIRKAAGSQNYKVTALREQDLDHGTAVPLYFLQRNGFQGRVVTLGYSFLSNDDHLRFGSCIRKAVEEVGRRVAFIASGDLSHRLKPHAPAGYNPNAHEFDDQVVDALRSNVPQRIVDIDYSLRKLAGECGYRSMLVAIGASSDLPLACEVLSYEAPFGVGYLVAQLINQAKLAAESTLPEIARDAVETFIRSGNILTPPESTTGLLSSPAPCFVCLKTLDGELRGCIGTIEPARETLAEEIVANAISAAINDPRFDPVKTAELSNLRYSVDVLFPAEPAEMKDLDPAVFGVIVEDEAGSRRGLLLPDIPGIDNAEQQVEIAARKAGIARDERIRLWRFKVERFGE
ncbi:MAG TPA: AmmeMemoRadiSam system protein A [Pyrinomonadaceae bacterium]|jgi:AmmeMemoRadiSam system protein A/AmmeMemoRadiSam system protein B|nr:AmmeMemoRadiSam system protein A [Pyrinomonadaceae bacterium]